MKPRIAVTMGDPGGIGPEVVLKSLGREDVRELLDPVIIGDIEVLQRNIPKQFNSTLIRISEHDLETNTLPGNDAIAVLQPYESAVEFSVGAISAENGKASHAYIVAAARATLATHTQAVCTAPISKEALFAAGFTVPGHTELLAETCGLESVRMMLVGGGLRVVLQTIHVALKEVPALLTVDSICETLHMINAFAADNGEHFPRIAVCGLNPHAGEGGHFGSEEVEIIRPAVENVQQNGMHVTGPLPADTVFHRALQSEFDYVLAMYHDQGLIPVKTLDFHGGVNVTVGLPLLRTSPDHGTAFGLAGLGVADESSMVAAIKYAAQLARRRM